MSIRVHKCLGYGLVDVSKKVDIKKFNELCEEHFKMASYDFVKWVKKNEKEIESLNGPETKKTGWMNFKYFASLPDSQKSTWMITDHFRHHSEHLEKGLVLIPLGMSWHRYDSEIDYYEEKCGSGPATKVTFLKHCCGLCPWMGMVRVRERQADFVSPESYIEASDYSRIVGWWSKNDPPLVFGDLLEHLLEDYRPVMPLDIAAFVLFFKDAFEDPKDFLNSLRPMIYSYWE